ncbi:MAG TPA: HNH endonuclease signature motif containing protein [Chthoniobacterales bacterium]|jgi:hypothetical protein
MAFSEVTKLEAKRRAHFMCVVCHQPFVEVHHIIPQAAGGIDDIENAATLCAYCHDLLGGNPDKCRQICQMRDLWYELCEQRFRDSPSLTLAKQLEELQSRQQMQGEMLLEMKNLMTAFYSNQSRELATATTVSTVEALSGVSIPQQKGPRWIRSSLSYSDLNSKSVFAQFVTNSGHGYEGKGKIRAVRNPQGLLTVDLVFTRRDTPFRFTEIIFHISPRQLPHLQRAATGADYDFLYDGVLRPDVEPD